MCRDAKETPKHWIKRCLRCFAKHWCFKQDHSCGESCVSLHWNAKIEATTEQILSRCASMSAYVCFFSRFLFDILCSHVQFSLSYPDLSGSLVIWLPFGSRAHDELLPLGGRWVKKMRPSLV
jgi:hypothetical protein